MMSRMASFAARGSALRRGLKYTAGGVTVGAGAYAYSKYRSDPGLQRQIQFWSVITPVVADYWWHVGASSPYRKYVASDDKDEAIAELHRRNAPRLYQVMIDLGSLYIKLGQVLSVTALPVPEAYRVYFRKLQSDVPGHEEFERVIRPTIERELGLDSIEDAFDRVEEIPCGAASIGQAHVATLKDGRRILLKIQYPDAPWQVPADIRCVGDFMKMCVWFGLVDEDASKLSYDEFSRQFLAELDYDRERRNLEEVYQSSLDPDAPYRKYNVVVPKVYPELSSSKIIAMEFLPGPKLEQEAKKLLSSLGIDTSKGVRGIVTESARKAVDTEGNSDESSTESHALPANHWSQSAIKLVSVDTLFSLTRWARHIASWYQSMWLTSLSWMKPLGIVPNRWQDWMEIQSENQYNGDWTKGAVEALLGVHGYQILNQGLFNADPHPGNILLVKDRPPKIGLIDYGQCKRLTTKERVKIANLLLSVANDESDEAIADRFRDLGIATKNDSTPFLAEFARLCFGPMQTKHLDHSWHREFHQTDRVLYFPSELSMVYRTSLLLRGLAMSLQQNVSVSEVWRDHALRAITDGQAELLTEDAVIDDDSQLFRRRQTSSVVVKLPPSQVKLK